MKIAECRLLLHAAISKTRITSPPDTFLGRTGAAELEMVQAYLNDGTTFAASDDPVNALASFYYAFGWLHCGNIHGTLVTEMTTVPCPFLAPCERIVRSHEAKLVEKAGRYQRLLDTARMAVTCAPDPSTYQCQFAGRVIQIAESYAIRGKWLLLQNRNEDALAAFSYGHGWLDAGARAGLFIITADREIFTV